MSDESEEKKAESTEEKKADSMSMSLDVAYKSLESVRKVNIQVEFGRNVDDSECISCLRQPQIVKGRFRQWVSDKTASKALACLTCGTPVCKDHRSADFGKQNITVCNTCSHLFSVDYMMKNIVLTKDDSREKKNEMLEVYDRALLILTYSLQFIDEVALTLEENTARHNKIGLGSSATGVVSGGLGVAAAATIFTPVGPPLLLASILFGGGAAAVEAGSEAVNYRSEPNVMADRILTLYSIITSISKLPEMVDLEGTQDTKTIAPESETQTALHWRRTAMNAVKPLTAGALSAVSIFTEAHEMKNTVDKIRAGNPCEKAERLRIIKAVSESLPKTDDLSKRLNQAIERQRTATTDTDGKSNSP